MQGQLFIQDFLTRGVTKTPPHQELNDAAFALVKTALIAIFAGFGAAAIANNEASPG